MTRKNTIAIVALILITVAIFSNTFGNAFIWDDKKFIETNLFVQHVHFIPFFFTVRYWKYYDPIAPGFYRPLRHLTLAIDYAIWKLNTFGYHLTNLILHLLNVLLLYFLVLKLIELSGGKERGVLLPFLTAAFFATHPVHTESVNWIKNRSDLLALFFSLASLFLFMRYIVSNRHKSGLRVYVFSLMSFILALISKEMALAVPLLVTILIICFSHRKDWLRFFLLTAPFFFAALLFLAFERIFLASAQIPAGMDAAKITLYSHILSIPKTLGYYIVLLFFPVNLTVERHFAIANSIFDVGVMASLLMLLATALLLRKAFPRHKLIVFSLLWVFATLVPASNIIFIKGRPIAEQRLYIPSVGFCLALACGIQELALRKLFSRRPMKEVVVACATPIVIFYSLVTFMRNFEWKDSLTFWTKTTQRSPWSSRAYYNLGNSYRDISDLENALSAYEKGLALNPWDFDAMNNIGNAYYLIGKHEQAAGYYKQALSINPGLVDAYANLGLVYQGASKTEEAIALYEKAIRLNPYQPIAYNNILTLYINLGKYREALGVAQRVLTLRLKIPELFYNMGIAYNGVGNNAAAAACYLNATRLNPNFAEAYNNLAISYFRLGEYKTAAIASQKAQSLGLDNSDLQKAIEEKLNLD